MPSGGRLQYDQGLMRDIRSAAHFRFRRRLARLVHTGSDLAEADTA